MKGIIKKAITGLLTILMFIMPVQASIDIENQPASFPLILVGDSRTEGMHETMGDMGCIWEFKSGEGYNWMTNTAIPEIEPYITQNAAVVIMLGVNDVGDVWMANQYISYLNEKASTWRAMGANTYYIAITKCADGYSDRWGTSNEAIAAWNEMMKNGLSKDVFYFDPTEMLGPVGTVDGLHYTNETYQKIYNIVTQFVTSVQYEHMFGGF